MLKHYLCKDDSIYSIVENSENEFRPFDFLMIDIGRIEDKEIPAYMNIKRETYDGSNDPSCRYGEKDIRNQQIPHKKY